MSQIMQLINLAPMFQEALLFLPTTLVGPDRLTEKRVAEIAQIVDWTSQWKLFRVLLEGSAL